MVSNHFFIFLIFCISINSYSKECEFNHLKVLKTQSITGTQTYTYALKNKAIPKSNIQIPEIISSKLKTSDIMLEIWGHPEIIRKETGLKFNINSEEVTIHGPSGDSESVHGSHWRIIDNFITPPVISNDFNFELLEGTIDFLAYQPLELGHANAPLILFTKKFQFNPKKTNFSFQSSLDHYLDSKDSSSIKSEITLIPSSDDQSRILVSQRGDREIIDLYNYELIYHYPDGPIQLAGVQYPFTQKIQASISCY